MRMLHADDAYAHAASPTMKQHAGFHMPRHVAAAHATMSFSHADDTISPPPPLIRRNTPPAVHVSLLICWRFYRYFTLLTPYDVVTSFTVYFSLFFFLYLIGFSVMPAAA